MECFKKSCFGSKHYKGITRLIIMESISYVAYPKCVCKCDHKVIYKGHNAHLIVLHNNDNNKSTIIKWLVC